MSWSNNCYKLPRIADYAAAKKRFDAFGARTEFVVSDYEPPRRGRHPKFS